MNRVAAAIYGALSYLLFLVVFLYAVGFVGNVLVPKGIDGPAEGSPLAAILVNVLLLGVFAVQHSVMARPGFKRWWTRVVPEPIERSTYVLLSSLALALLFWQWRPLTGLVWDVAGPFRTVLQAGFWLGWLVVLTSTFMLNHFELFGLRQVWLNLRGQAGAPAAFRAPLLYGFVRHPIMLGFLIAFWSAPTMTAGHLLFSLATTGYILIALQFEERDLVAYFGDTYRQYRERVPMLLPFVKFRSGSGGTKTPASPGP
jgi:protein-S-isoprenylcysteine O-methyltransferase Ste14